MADEREIIKPPLRSSVWKHFGFCKDGDVLNKSLAVCRICKGQVKYNGNTTNLSNHLLRRHGISHNTDRPGTSCSVPAATAAKGKVNSAEASGLACMFSQRLGQNSARAKNITATIAKFICKDMQPYSVVENPGFREMIQTLEPRYTIPSRPHFSEKVIPALYESTKKDVKLSLSQAERVAITTDGWTSCSNQGYVTITSHHIDPEWKMKTFVLLTRVLNEAHTGKNIGALLREACMEWKIYDKNPAIVTDNARNMIVASAEAQFSPHITCFAHTLNLASQKGLGVDRASRLLGKVRKIVGYFHRSPIACHALQEKQTLMDLPKHKLIQDIITRWNSSFEMLERFLEQQPAIMATLMSKDLRKGVTDVGTLSESDIANMDDIVQLMGPVKMATTMMCEEDQPTLSVIAPLQAKLLKHLQPCEDDSTQVAEIKRVMASDLSTRYRGTQDALNIASALDPRFKELPYLEKEDREQVYTKLVFEAEVSHQMQAMGNQEEDEGSSSTKLSGFNEETTAPNESPPCKKKALDALFGDSFTQRERKSTSKTARAEVLRYRAKDALPLTENAMKWWRSQEKELPVLSTLAKRYLCIPGTSVPAERIFSTAGDIVNAQRSVLRPDHVDELIFLKKNL
ncbi:E3 SUMO-protein ligase ZBED1-like isoform X1 [Coregonus clupeaformis]|uniref:E3 SUMO-protein ligase ZBED1-like isoform X1 n=1 Tax=Coregonus clupeaformis TaxID=59861 RepID=UPI001E1C7ED8|nr:E3 SUMO-protein ligase ZBED1-like isoform X1 [Coregonus clupeaformis]